VTLSRRRCLQLATLASGGLALASAATETVAEGPYKEALGWLKLYLDRHLEAFSLPGITVALADGNGFSATVTAGWADVDRRQPVTPEHYFQIGSISKSFAALAVLKLADERRLSLDDEVTALLPELRFADYRKITLRHLLTHSSGLAAMPPLAPRATGGTLWQGFAPGSQFSYSNTGYQLLGLIVERLRGKPYPQALAADVLEPLGLGAILPSIRAADRDRYAVGYAPYFPDRTFPRGGRLGVGPWVNFANAAGCLAVTPAAMAGYMRWLIDSAAGRGAPLLTPESRRLFTKPAIEAAEFGAGARYALGMSVLPIDGRPCLFHTGGMLTFSSSLMVDEAAGVGAFASVNADAGEEYRPQAVTAYAIKLMRAVRERRALPLAPPIRPATRIDDPKRLTGRFAAADGKSVELVAAGEGLALRRDAALLPLQGEGDGPFIVVGPGDETSMLHLDVKDGAVRGVGWRSDLYGAGAAGKPDEALRRCAGVYDAGDPWIGILEVMARPDGLWLGGATPLVRRADGSFRVGADADSPEWVRFDLEIDGHPQRMVFSGVDLMRV